MLKKLYPVLVLAACLYQLPLAAQLMPCEGGRTYWVVNKDSIHYAMEIPGRGRATEKENTILVDNDRLTCEIIRKNTYADPGAKNPDLKLLLKHMALETDSASRQVKTRLKLQVQSVPISEEQEVMLWHYELPEKADPGIKARVHASLILNEHIITLSSPQFNSQGFDEVKDFLMEMMSKVKWQEDMSRICKN